ncbi:hypothetical protein ISCGN_021973 [Ixodes scapularis]
MKSILRTFPEYKKAVDGRPLCFSVSAAVHLLWQNKKYITRIPRHELCNRTFLEMFKRHGYDRQSKTQFYTDNYTRVYFEDRDHFREKVRELLDMWPHDKCIIFDGLDMDAVGDDTGRRARKRALEDLHALTADEVFQVGQLGDGSIPVEEQHGRRERSHLLSTFNSDLESLEPDEAQRADLRPQQISESSGSELSSSEPDEFDRVDFQPGDNPESSGTEFESSEANEFDRADLQPQNIPESSIRYEE